MIVCTILFSSKFLIILCKFNLVYISIFDYYKILNSAKCLLYLAWPLLHCYIVSCALNPFKADRLKSYCFNLCVFFDRITSKSSRLQWTLVQSRSDWRVSTITVQKNASQISTSCLQIAMYIINLER